MEVTSEMLAAIIGSAGVTGVIGGVVSYYKDRKKDLATAKLTDVQALQQQVSLMDQVTRFLRAENERLQADYNASEEARRIMRQRMSELEEELQKVKRNAALTQQQCEDLSRQLKAFLRGDDGLPPA